MSDRAEIFQRHYEDYLAQVVKVDLEAVAERLGLEREGDGFCLRFFGQPFLVSPKGLTDEAGGEPDYVAAVVLCQYILLCPEAPFPDERWSSFREFKAVSHFTNVNFFASDTERALGKVFAGRAGELRRACRALGGVEEPLDISYDCAYRFKALPRIDLLMLFNDGDEEFPADGTVLFLAQSEQYLDPESLIIASATLVKKLKAVAGSPS